MPEFSPQQQRIQSVLRSGGPSRMACVLTVEGAVDPDGLRAAVERVLQRHDILRQHGHEWISGVSDPECWFESERNRSDPHAAVSCGLVELDHARFALLIGIPAISADVRTATILANEVAAVFEEGSLAEAPFPYSEYTSIVAELDEDGAATAAAECATRDEFQLRRIAIDPSLAPAIQSLATSCHASARDVLLAAWRWLLHRLSLSRETTVGCRVDGRIHEALQSVPGPFAAYTAMMTPFSPMMPFPHLIVEPSDDVRLVGPLQFGFAFDDVSERIERPRLTVSVQHAYSCTDRFEVQLTCQQTADRMMLELEYDSSAQSEAKVRALGACLGELLRSAVANRQAPVSELNVLTAAALQEISQHSTTPRTAPEDELTLQRFERTALHHPEAVAIAQGDRVLCYRDLNSAADRLASHLRALGVRDESLVAIVLPPCAEVLVSMLAVWKAGAAYVPLDSQSPAERLRAILGDASVSAVIIHSSMSPPGVDVPFVCADAEFPEVAHAGEWRRRCHPSQLAYVIYTSGSTGAPKGVMVTHGGLSNYLNWAIREYAPAGAGAPLHSSVAFDMAVTSLFLPLLTGSAIRIADANLRAEALAGVLREHGGFSFVKLTPALARVTASQLTPVQVNNAASTLILGGEALSSSDLALWRACAPATVIVNEYGPTETVVGSCAYRVEPGDSMEGPTPIGRPINNTSAYVLDSFMRLLPPGVEGELYLGGDGVARGYLNRPALTAEKFVPDPFSSQPGARLYRTGDLTILNERGDFEYRGRIDHQIKVRGYRVEPGEIEAALLRHASVCDAGVIARAEADGTQLLTACAVISGAAPSARELRTFLGEHLPEYMIPAEFIFLEAMPLTANGKVDRSALLSARSLQAAAPYVAPRNEIEEILAGVWEQVLGTPGAGIDDNYFALGGDSIRSLQIVSRAHMRGVKVTVDQIFKRQTIRELAAEIANGRASSEPSIASAPFSLISESDRAAMSDGVEDAYPLSRLQAGMVFHGALNPESAVYHDIFYFDVRAPLDPDLMRRAVQALSRRHPMLRTSFDLSKFSEPLQLVHKDASAPLIVHDHRMLEEDQQEAALAAWVREEKNHSFDLHCAPLLRFHMFLRGADRFVFALTFHHAILDGWSDAIMLIELALLYRRFLKNEPVAGEPLRASYRDFIALERHTAASQESRDFWRRYLDSSHPSELPQGRTDPSEPGIAIQTIELPATVSDALQAVARRAAVPLKTVLLAAHLRVIGFLSGTTDVLTTMTSVGRLEVLDGDQVLGLHLNSTPFRLALRTERWIDLVQRTFGQERELLPHRRFPLADLRGVLEPSPAAEHHFYFTHYHVVERLDEFPELEILGQGGFEVTSFPLVANFSLHPTTRRLNAYLTCRLSRFSPEQVEAMAGYYQQALHALASEPDRYYYAQSLLRGAGAAPVLRSSDEATADATDLPPVHAMVEAQAARTPDAVAVICGGERYTYRELVTRASRIAGYLRSRGATGETPVAVSMPRSAGVIAAVLGILQSGAVCVPLDSSYPTERIEFMTRDAHVSLVLDSDVEGDAAPSAKVSQEQGAYVVFTSGSTGRPKGILLPHRVLSNLIRWHNENHVNGVRTLHAASISFDVSFYEMFTALASGGTVVLADENERVDAARLLRLLIDQEVEKAILPVVMLRQLASISVESGDYPRALREVIVTGDQLAVTSQVAAFFEELPGCRLHNHYGPSETHVATAYKLGETPSAWPALPPVGGPIANARVCILDRFLMPSAPGAPGEIYIGGDCLARGYLGPASLTAERFIPDPFSGTPGARLYRTGDLARLTQDGAVEFLGRADQQLKIRGHRVEPGEIETRLSEHPSIRQAVVVARADTRGGKRLIAYAEPAEESMRLTDHEMCEFLARTLPEYMIPSRFVWLDSLPLNHNGKVDRRSLPEPEPFSATSADAYVAPRTVTEEALASFWADVLGIPQAGIHDNFFRTGGDSLLATRLIAVLRSELEIDLPLRVLFEKPTISQLAPVIEEALNRQAEAARAR